jgi:hypothetical protein
MCQLDQTEPFTPAKPIRCYRVYEVRDDHEYGFYGHWSRPLMNTRTTAQGEPFHAFQRLKDVREWIAYCVNGLGFNESIVVYRCEATGEVRKGTWDVTNIKTFTCTEITLLKKIGTKETIMRKK